VGEAAQNAVPDVRSTASKAPYSTMVAPISPISEFKLSGQTLTPHENGQYQWQKPAKLFSSAMSNIDRMNI
jgi:hypothetical protein